MGEEWVRLTPGGSPRSGRASYKRGDARTLPHMLRERTDLWLTGATIYLTTAELAAIPPVKMLIHVAKRARDLLGEFWEREDASEPLVVALTCALDAFEEDDDG